MERLFLTFGEIDKLKEKYPGKIPIFVTKSPNARDIPDITKHRFLAPSDLRLSQFIWVIRKQIQLENMNQLDEEVLPAPILDDGLGLSDRYENIDGDLWEVADGSELYSEFIKDASRNL